MASYTHYKPAVYMEAELDANEDINEVKAILYAEVSFEVDNLERLELDNFRAKQEVKNLRSIVKYKEEGTQEYMYAKDKLDDLGETYA